MINIEKVKKIFKEYVSHYNINDGKIALKYNHILRVAEISKRIATELKLSEEDVKLAELIGIFHDIGRFEQVRRFNTFVDKDSINHGEYGVKILFDDGLIEKFDIDERYYKTIKLAILNHNRKAIEDDGMSEKDLLHCKIIRDSDKLDIFYILATDTMDNIYGCMTMENEELSDEIIREFKEDHYIDYKKRKNCGDIWISHMAYVFDFNYKSSYKVLLENDYINKFYKRMDFKKEKTIKQAEEIVKIANEFVKKQ